MLWVARREEAGAGAFRASVEKRRRRESTGIKPLIGPTIEREESG